MLLWLTLLWNWVWRIEGMILLGGNHNNRWETCIVATSCDTSSQWSGIGIELGNPTLKGERLAAWFSLRPCLKHVFQAAWRKEHLKTDYIPHSKSQRVANLVCIRPLVPYGSSQTACCQTYPAFIAGLRQRNILLWIKKRQELRFDSENRYWVTYVQNFVTFRLMIS